MASLWTKTVEPQRGTQPLTEFDVYLIFREAFLRQPDVRLYTRTMYDGALFVGIERDDDHASVVVSASAVILAARKAVRVAAREAVRDFNGAARCIRKVWYATAYDADVALVSTIQRSFRDRAPRREVMSYRCPHCKGWHLTSQMRDGEQR